MALEDTAVTSRRDALALIIVVGVLAVLAVVATAFVMMAELERKASQQRFLSTKAYLLARSGIEDVLARIALRQDPEVPGNRYLGEDWDASGTLNGFEGTNEVYRPGTLDQGDCPLRHAMRPSFFARSQVDLGADGLPAPRRVGVDGRDRGYSGLLLGDKAPEGNTYAIKFQPDGIHINGGDVASTSTAMDGPNGFLVRLLNNLEAVVDNVPLPTLGVEIVSNRPSGGYGSVAQLSAVLGTVRYLRYEPFLATYAWVDPQMLKPQPMNGRPRRWLDIDPKHQTGSNADTRIVGSDTSSGVAGLGTEASPWSQNITMTNIYEGARTYPVTWEKNFVYSWKQMRPAPPAFEPRAPLSLGAPAEALAAVFMGLKGTHLHVWDGPGGWDGGFGWFGAGTTYAYPSDATEGAPWIRQRADYGMGYDKSGSRLWYGPLSFDPNAPSVTYPYLGKGKGSPVTPGGEPVVEAAPLGRLRESQAITRDQAIEIARQLKDRASQAGPIRTWTDYNTWVDLLPLWEDVDNNLVLDGTPYTVVGSLNTYDRRRYEREDASANGVVTNGALNRRTFTLAAGSWSPGPPVWTDLLGAPLPPGSVPGLTFLQKDALKAMANPNADLNDFNPDANLFKEIDKLDLAGIDDAPSSFHHTTELALESQVMRVLSLGRVVSAHGRLLAQRTLSARVKLFDLYRDSTQADFMREYTGGAALSTLFTGVPPPGGRPLAGAGDQYLVSYPEPQALGGAPAADALYDGRIGLGLVGPIPAPLAWAVGGVPDEKLRGSLFGTADASDLGDAAVPDVRGPFLDRLVKAAGPEVGNIFPDGVYSEKDSAIKYPMPGNFIEKLIDPALYSESDTHVFYLSFWVKVNWFPEASPRPHALLSLSTALAPLWNANSSLWLNPQGVGLPRVPVDDIQARPLGLYFVPARNNYWQNAMGVYDHGGGSTKGLTWPSRSLNWGTAHSLYASDNLNRRGILNSMGAWWPGFAPLPASVKPVGRLEGHRWVHAAVMGKTSWSDFGGAGYGAKSVNASRFVMNRRKASQSGDGGGWNLGIGNVLDGYRNYHLGDLSQPNHIRLGEAAAEHSMNYVADATFADVKTGGRVVANSPGTYGALLDSYEGWFQGPDGPGAQGRYYKEAWAAYRSPLLPAVCSLRPLRATWTEIPCDLWFDANNDGTGFVDGWMGDAVNGYKSRNDQFSAGGVAGANGLRDVHIELEVWDDLGTAPTADDVLLARFQDASAANALKRPVGRLYYKALFVNEWDGVATRPNIPLDVTPYLDDVTVTYQPAGGMAFLSWDERAP